MEWQPDRRATILFRTKPFEWNLRRVWDYT